MSNRTPQKRGRKNLTVGKKRVNFKTTIAPGHSAAFARIGLKLGMDPPRLLEYAIEKLVALEGTGQLPAIETDAPDAPQKKAPLAASQPKPTRRAI